MPQFIAAALVAAIGVTAGTVTAAILTAVIAMGITAGISALIGAVFKPARPKPSDGQQVIRQAVGSRRRHYGIVHTGGQLSFYESAGGTLAQVVTLGTGEESEILEHRINGKTVTVVGEMVTDSSFHGALTIHTRPGAASQTAITALTALFPAWTADHRQRGCAHAAILAGPVKQELFSEVYNGQVPQYTQVRKAAKVYDPRLDYTRGGIGPQRLDNPATWQWSDNGALVIADYAAHPDGYGLGYDRINWANMAEEADICDQTLTTVTAETIKRWRLWASYSLSQDERREVLSDMAKAIDAFTWQDAQGLFNLKVGRWEAPGVTITDDHIMGMSARLGPQAQQRVSAIKVLYTEAAIGYREQESATIGGGSGEDPNTDPQSVDAYYAPHHNQAARIGKLVWNRLSDGRWHITAQLNLFGLNLLGERFCRLQSAQLGVTGWFAIDALQLDLGRMRVVATLSEVDPADWDFDAATEEGSPPGSSVSSGGTVTIEVPTGLALSAVQIALGETTAVSIEANWAAASRADLAFEARYRPSAGGTWVMMAVDQDARTARTGPLDSGTEYAVEIRALTLTGRASAWSAAATMTPEAVALLSAPSELAATGGTGSADVTFRLPIEPSLAFARLYRTTASSFTSPVQVGPDVVGALGEVIAVADTGLSAGTKYYWTRAFNGSGGSSALAGPVAAVVS